MVEVFTRENCAACTGTKAALTKLGIEFTEINVQAAGNEHIAQQLVDEGWRSMPVVKTDTTSWSGSNPEKIRALRA